MLEAAYIFLICFDNDDYGVDCCHNGYGNDTVQLVVLN